MQKDQRILLVEDDGGIVWSLNEVLRGEGFEVCAVSGETEAKRYHEGGSLPDVILLDLSLADGNGFSLFGRIKSKHPIPVIFLTASGDEESVCRDMEELNRIAPENQKIQTHILPLWEQMKEGRT